jgi:hypothetical protein
VLIVNGLPRPAPEADVPRILRQLPRLPAPSPTPTPTPTPPPPGPYPQDALLHLPSR